MHNFNIKNNVDEAVIDIYGEIGESWFDEGITMQSINDQLSQIKSNKIVVNISSLGGDVAHAFTIYDLLKSKNAHVTTKITGATASSGTIIAMAGDKIEMSDNALFLIHNVWTMAVGNADDMRKTADDLDKFDGRVVNIYKKKTGKRKSQILSLMEEEKWIDAEEAKNFGFIDAIFNDKKVMNKATIKQINNSKYLPKLKVMNKDFNNINGLLGVDGFESSDEGVYLNQEQLKVIDEKLSPVDMAQIKAEIEAEFENQINDLKAENKTAIETLTKENTELIEGKDKEIETLNAKVEELQNLYDNSVKDTQKSNEKKSEKQDPEIKKEEVETIGNYVKNLKNYDDMRFKFNK